MAESKFNFRLESLLDVRRAAEKECQRKLAEIQQQIQLLMREIEDTQARIAAEDKALTSEKLVGTLDMLYIAHEKRFVGNLHMKIVLALQRVAASEVSLNAARAKLLAAARDRKVIEKLKEKQLARWRAEQDKKESAQLDELATQMTLRQQMEAF